MSDLTSSKPNLFWATLLALGMVATVGGALGFEHIGGYIPCALCLLQRLPYYYGIPVAAAAALSAALGGPAWLTRGLIGLAGLLMLVGKRTKLLKYLRTAAPDRYTAVIERHGLRR